MLTARVGGRLSLRHLQHPQVLGETILDRSVSQHHATSHEAGDDVGEQQDSSTQYNKSLEAHGSTLMAGHHRAREDLPRVAKLAATGLADMADSQSPLIPQREAEARGGPPHSRLAQMADPSTAGRSAHGRIRL